MGPASEKGYFYHHHVEGSRRLSFSKKRETRHLNCEERQTLTSVSAMYTILEVLQIPFNQTCKGLAA